MNITVKTFQALNEINSSPLDPVDKSMAMVKAVSGVEDINQLSQKKLAKICQDISETFNKWSGADGLPKAKDRIKVQDKTFKICQDIYQMTAAKYVEAITFSKESVKNLHMMLATMVVPQQWTWKGYKDIPYPAEHHAKVSEQMLDADYDDIYPSLVRFMDSLGKISKEFGYLWEGEQGESTGAMAAAFSKIWGWVYQTKLVAEFEGISMEAAWDLPVRRYLNDLSYLKMKREVDDEYMRKMELKRR